jgi:hypothetical protein
MVLLALNCIMREHRNRNLDHYVKKPSTGLAEEQHADGSFGNLHSTALAVQVCVQYNMVIHDFTNTAVSVFFKTFYCQGTYNIHICKISGFFMVVSVNMTVFWDVV